MRISNNHIFYFILGWTFLTQIGSWFFHWSSYWSSYWTLFGDDLALLVLFLITPIEETMNCILIVSLTVMMGFVGDEVIHEKVIDDKIDDMNQKIEIITESQNDLDGFIEDMKTMLSESSKKITPTPDNSI